VESDRFFVLRSGVKGIPPGPRPAEWILRAWNNRFTPRGRYRHTQHPSESILKRTQCSLAVCWGSRQEDGQSTSWRQVGWHLMAYEFCTEATAELIALYGRYNANQTLLTGSRHLAFDRAPSWRWARAGSLRHVPALQDRRKVPKTWEKDFTYLATPQLAWRWPSPLPSAGKTCPIPEGITQ